MLSHYSEKIDWGKLENLLSLRELACGVSKPFSNIMDSRIYYEQALNALLYGNQYCRKKAIYFYQDFTLIHMLDVVNQNSPNNIMNFCHYSINTILEYDALYRTEWFKSLYMYLFFDKNLRKSSESLNINKSSMHYRVNKIREIIGPSFDHPNFVFQMKMSIKILYYLEGDNFYKKYKISRKYKMISSS